MREKLRRYGKRVMVFICTFVIFAGSIFSFSFESKASDVFTDVDAKYGDFYVNYAEPSTSSGHGYLSLLIGNQQTGETRIETWFFASYFVDSGVYAPSEMYVVMTPTQLTFNVGQVDATAGWYTVSLFNGDGTCLPMFHSDSGKSYWYYSNTADIILGYRYGGSLYLETTVTQTDNNFNLYFSDDGEAKILSDILSKLNAMYTIDKNVFTYIQQIYSAIGAVKTDVSSIQTTLKSLYENYIQRYMGIYQAQLGEIWNDLSELNEKLDEYLPQIVEEQKESNSWLEKIWNSIQEFFGKEPAEDAAPPVDGDNMLGDIQETEDVLFPDTSSAEQSLDVQLNSGFSVLTWLVESFAKLDSGVFAMFLTMLTFGVMALLLGR